MIVTLVRNPISFNKILNKTLWTITIHTWSVVDDFQGDAMQLLSALSCVSAGLSAVTVSDVSRSRTSDFKRFGPSIWLNKRSYT